MFKQAILLLLLLSYSVQGLTISYGEGKTTLKTVVPEGKVTEINRSIRIRNDNNITVKASLTPSKNLESIIQVKESQIILEPGEMAKANFTITLRSGGRYEGKILIKFSAVDPSLKMASVGGASLLTIAAEGPVNDYFYIDTGEAKPSSNRTGSLQAAKEVKADKTSALAGALIVLVIAAVGTGVFFIMRQRRKK